MRGRYRKQRALGVAFLVVLSAYVADCVGGYQKENLDDLDKVKEELEICASEMNPPELGVMKEMNKVKCLKLLSEGKEKLRNCKKIIKNIQSKSGNETDLSFLSVAIKDLENVVKKIDLGLDNVGSAVINLLEKRCCVCSGGRSKLPEDHKTLLKDLDEAFQMAINLRNELGSVLGKSDSVKLRK